MEHTEGQALKGAKAENVWLFVYGGKISQSLHSF
jgi:hypothetical protein